MDSTCTLSQQLVYDLGHFIGVMLGKEKLSPSAEKHRSELHQSLQPFIVPEIEIPDEDEYEDPSSIRITSQLSNHSLSGQSDDGSKLNITLNELKKMSPKYGPLWRKEKAIFREVWRKYIAGLYEQKLILFCSEKDMKPTTCINIQGYVARSAPNIQRDVKKKEITFELICPGKKDYQFFARTAKDMEQWVAIICQTSIQHLDVSMPSRAVPDHRLVISIDGSDMETYDDVTSYGDDAPVEEFYDDIIDSKHSGTEQTSPMQDQQATSKKDSEEEDEEEEIYNDVEEYEEASPKPDAEPMMWHVERKFNVMDRRPPLPPPTVLNTEIEEDIYQDIAECQQNLPPKPVQVMKPENGNVPPLPARRPLPSIPKDEVSEEEEEETYEDIDTSIHSNTKQPEKNLRVSEKIKEEEDDFEETYDDIGSPNQSTKENLTQNFPVSQSHTEEVEEVEEIYDDVGHAEPSPQTKNQFVSSYENKNSTTNIQSSHYKIGEIRNQSKTSGLKEKEPINITINVTTKEIDENNQTVVGKKLLMRDRNSAQNVRSKEETNQSFLQRNYLRQNGKTGVNVNVSTTKHSSLKNEISKQSGNTTDIKTKSTLQNQVPKQNTNVRNMGNKFNQPKNNSFLHRHSSQEDEGNVQSILQKLQSKNTESNDPSSQFKKSTMLSNSTSSESPSNDINSEKNTANFQNALKKIEASFGDKLTDGIAMKSNLPTSPNRPLQKQSSVSPYSGSPTNSLNNRQNRPLPSKPTISSLSSETPELPSPSSDSASSSPANSRTEFSLELPVNKPNTMSNSPSIQISVSPHQLSPMLPKNRPNLSHKPEKPPNKPSMNIKVTMPVKNSPTSSRNSLNRTRNGSNALPVSIPNVPNLPKVPSVPNVNASEPPKLPPRLYLK